MNSTKSGLLGILGLILGVLLIFFVLNYFNILSLSQLYPNFFGNLPHRQILLKTPPPPKTTPTPTPILQGPQKLSNGLYSADAIFQSYTKTTATLALSDGIKTLNYDNKTTLLNVNFLAKPAKTTQFTDPNTFFSQINKGDLMFVIYSASGSALYANQIQHMLPKK